MMRMLITALLMLTAMTSNAERAYDINELGPLFTTVKERQQLDNRRAGRSPVSSQEQRLSPSNITVNGIAPTFVYTEMIRHVMENPEFKEALLSRIPLGRIADPSDIVGATVFFAAPASSFITGQILYLDGGITASQ